MEITKEELVQLIKDTVMGMEKAEEMTEETFDSSCSKETAENACSD